MARKKKTHDEFLDDLDVRNPTVERKHIKGTYELSQQKIHCECPDCGDDWYPKACALISNNPLERCSNCGNKRSGITNRLELSNFQQNINLVNELAHTFVVTKFTTTGSEVTCECLDCGNEFTVNCGNYLTDPRSLGACPSCYPPECSAYTEDNLQNRIDKVHGKNKLIWDKNTKDLIDGNRSMIRLYCPKCDRYSRKRLHDVINSSTGCKCQSNNKSEDRLIALLKATIPNVEIVEQWRPEFLKSKKGQQSCDLYLPRYGIVIERHGEQHYGPKAKFKKDGCPDKAFAYTQSMDRRKRRLLKTNGILQIDIPYFDFSTQHGIKRQSIFLQYFILFLAKQIKNRKLGVGGYRAYNQERFMKGVNIPVEARSLVV